MLKQLVNHKRVAALCLSRQHHIALGCLGFCTTKLKTFKESVVEVDPTHTTSQAIATSSLVGKYVIMSAAVNILLYFVSCYCHMVLATRCVLTQ